MFTIFVHQNKGNKNSFAYQNKGKQKFRCFKDN